MIGQPNEGPVTLEAVMGLLKDGALRRFRIDIETDSTIVGDESQEKKDRTEFIASMTQMVQAWGPIIAGAPPLLPLFGALATFGVRAFRVGRELEETIEDTLERMEELLNAPKPPPPEAEAEKINLEVEKVKANAVKVKSDAEIAKAELALRMAEFEAHVKAMDHQRNQETMAAEQSAKQAEQMAEAQEPEEPEENKSEAVLKSLLEQNQQVTLAATQAMASALQTVNKPKRQRVVRGPDGRVEGVETIADEVENGDAEQV